MAPTNTNTTPVATNKSTSPNSATVTPAPILLGDQTIFLNVDSDMMKKIVESLEARDLFKILPKKMSHSDVARLRAAVGPGNAKIDNAFILHKVLGVDFDGNSYAPEPDVDLTPLKSDPMGLVPPARVFLDKKEFIYEAENTTQKFKYIGSTDEPDSTTGMLAGDGKVLTPHVDAEGNFVPIDVTYEPLKRAFDAAHAKKQHTPKKRNIAATLPDAAHLPWFKPPMIHLPTKRSLTALSIAPSSTAMQACSPSRNLGSSKTTTLELRAVFLRRASRTSSLAGPDLLVLLTSILWLVSFSTSSWSSITLFSLRPM
jgi:hypothetical protein